MPKWFFYATIAMLSFGVWSLIANKAINDLTPFLTEHIQLTNGQSSEEAKKIATAEAPYMVQVLSAFGIVPFTVPLLFSKKLRRGTNFPRGAMFAVGCGVFSAVGNLLLYQAIADGGPVSIVYPLTNMPLLAVLAAPFLFHERISKAQGAGVVLAMAAIGLLSTDPTSSLEGSHFFASWTIFAVLCILSFGVAMTTQKAATYHIADELSTVIYTLAFLAVGGYLMVRHPLVTATLPKVSFVAMVPSLLIGVLMGIGTLTLYAAYRHGKATIVSPYALMYPLITVAVGVSVYGEHLDLLRGIGVVCALLGGVLLGMEKSQTTTIDAAADAVAGK